MSENKTRKLSGIQLLLRGLLGPAFILAILLISAGHLDYWQAWLFMVVNGLLILANYLTLRKYPDLIDERLSPGEGMKSWDKTYFILSTPIYLSMLVLAGLDVGRFGWTGSLPTWVYVLGYTLYIGGQALFLWAKAANRYFSSVVRIQTDRGQTVCTDGPYRYVRHPGYAGSLLYMLSGGIVLGSIYAVIPQIIGVVLLMIRTSKEDQLLQDELPGYKEFAQQTHFRLIPFVW